MTAQGERPRAERAAEPTARRTAVEVVGRVQGGAYLAPALRSALDRSRLTPIDRSFVTDLAYGVLRRQIWLDAALEPRLKAPEQLPESVRSALRLAAYELLVRGTPPHAAVHAWVETVKAQSPRFTGLVNAVLRRLQAPDGAARTVRLALPAWLFERFEAALGEDAAVQAAEAMLEPAPLWLLSYAADAGSQLTADGCAVEDGPLPATLRVRSPLPLDRLGAYRGGAVQPQNPASTVPARVLAPRPGERVLDLAAGHGVKTAQLAAAGATVTAVDVDARKTRARAANLHRLGLEADHVTADLAAAELPAALRPAPAVLLDAPCSGSGTLRGHPEIKLRLGPGDLATTAALQSAMLDNAATLTAPGGRLVYAVCSLTDVEGEEQAAAFLRRHPCFRPAAFEPGVPHVATANGAYLLPHSGLDGFYLTDLRRA